MPVDVGGVVTGVLVAGGGAELVVVVVVVVGLPPRVDGAHAIVARTASIASRQPHLFVGSTKAMDTGVLDAGVTNARRSRSFPASFRPRMRLQRSASEKALTNDRFTSYSRDHAHRAGPPPYQRPRPSYWLGDYWSWEIVSSSAPCIDRPLPLGERSFFLTVIRPLAPILSNRGLYDDRRPL